MRTILKNILVALLFSLPFLSVHSESVKPTAGVKIEREVSCAVIENKTYYNAVIELDAADWGAYSQGVKVTVKDIESRKTIYKKRFSKSFLYGFSDGTLQVGKGNILTQVSIFKLESTGVWIAQIKQKGIY